MQCASPFLAVGSSCRKPPPVVAAQGAFIHGTHYEQRILEQQGTADGVLELLQLTGSAQERGAYGAAIEGAPPPTTRCVSVGGSHSGARRALFCPVPELAAPRFCAVELPRNTPSCWGMGARLPTVSLSSATQYLGAAEMAAWIDIIEWDTFCFCHR